MRVETNSQEETFALGRRLGEVAKQGQIYMLNGESGSGKTIFTKGMAAGLGIADPVNSPTFTIMQEYSGGRLPLYHFDVYRIGDPKDMEEIGYDDYFFGKGVCLIEWAALIRELLPEGSISVSIDKDLEKDFDYFDYRLIHIEGIEEDEITGN
ncbi:MAG: tRNA (adenosine(37)-N6)-threonylcarbamoyltransferase complex ATPase subunit type 1 TsaE [Lachnospiraceae bacterium]|nr:tRNA (adenosine(37)-N6)-threonylcarbamoyltransferase complex ATPase subunit type 1 TsaE [Lachnospiraceae bacterium]